MATTSSLLREHVTLEGDIPLVRFKKGHCKEEIAAAQLAAAKASGPHKSVQALEAGLRSWIKAWNKDPKPFVWKKSAETIHPK